MTDTPEVATVIFKEIEPPVYNTSESLFPNKWPIRKPGDLIPTETALRAMPKVEDGHILAVGTSGSGKSSCFVIPSLKKWTERIFCIDVKGELYKHTRDKRPNIKVFDPLDPLSCGYNPFEALGGTENKAPEAEAISMTLIPVPPDAGNNAFWIHSARNLLTGFILHFYNTGTSFVEAMEKIHTPDISQLIKDVYENTTSEEARLYLGTFISMPAPTLHSIEAELKRHITRFATDKDIIRCLSQENNISPNDLENGEDIYIRIPEYGLGQWKSLLTLMVSQFLRHFEKRPDMMADPILFMLDEFARLGKIEGITDAFATLRSKKITVCAVIQSLAQLDVLYGEPTRRVIVDNCQYIAIFGVTDVTSQQYFSSLIGGRNRWNKGFGLNLPPSAGVSVNKNREPFIYPEQFATLKMIVLLTPNGVYCKDKIPFFVDLPEVATVELRAKLAPVDEYHLTEEGYSYELTDEQWERIKHLMPPQQTGKKGKPPKDHRDMLNAILWKARSELKWEDIPERYGSWKTVYDRFNKWHGNGLLLSIFTELAAFDYDKLVKNLPSTKGVQPPAEVEKR
jgi:type IV secretion system protein VirD4